MGSTLGDLVVRMAHGARSLSVLTDGELLDLFAATNDGAAFAALVERHGAMVLGVCQRALSNRHDAEDACQAAFLVLARKAGPLRRKESLSCWLRGVASRVAINARRDAALRKRREAGVEPPARRCPAEEATWGEIRAALDEELGRLPERYRAPLVTGLVRVAQDRYGYSILVWVLGKGVNPNCGAARLFRDVIRRPTTRSYDASQARTLRRGPPPAPVCRPCCLGGRHARVEGPRQG
jgi:RNA polymerase sigma factor (sigma-70 family)